MQDKLDLLKKHQVSKLVADILLSQDLSLDNIKQILEDKKYPLLSADLDKVVIRILQAKADNEKVVIVGDYDADGIMATTILYKTLKQLNIDVGFYIPNRLNEGYGLSENIVKMVNEKKYNLIIAVDNGVSAISAIEYAKKLNIETIVIDHHKIDENINYKFTYLLHPNQLPNGYNDLCGAGLALLVAKKLLNDKNIAQFYIYAMIATIADMVSVFGYNRNIIKNGLYVLNKYGDKHIESLLTYNNNTIDQQVISFQVVPKLNSFGRMSDIVNVNNVVRYFLLDDIKQISEAAKSINELNQKRINLVRNSLDNNNNNIKKYGKLNVVVNTDISEGIAGLVAGRYMNTLNEPTIVLTSNNGILKGSGRSPKGFDLFALINPYKHLLESFGGHKQACGISIRKDQLDKFLKEMEVASNKIDYEVFEDPYLLIDENTLSNQTYYELLKLEPYGVDFIKPLFKVNITNLNKPTILANKFLKWPVKNDVELLSFDRKLDLDYYKNVDNINALVDISINNFNNKETLNLIIQQFL